VTNLFKTWRSRTAEPNGVEPLNFDILKTIREAAIVVRENTEIGASNEAACEAFSRGSGTLETKRLTAVIRDLNVHQAFQKALKKKESSEIRFEFHGGERRIYDLRTSPINLGGAPGAVGIFYDVTEIEKLETVRQEFLSNVSHELRTPLTAIIAFVETLEDGAIEDSENNRRFLGVIHKNADRMHRLIDDILTLSSIEAGRISVDIRQVDISSLIDDITTNVSAKAGARKIQIHAPIPSGSFVFADRSRLDQMITNLVDNAVKFNRSGGKIEISLKSPGDCDHITVKDEGEGISSEHLPRIFERFYRTDRARSREIGGTGLGLAIVKHLARLHGGEITVSSALGKGSAFTITLPRGGPQNSV
jgi:two-component system, OmpR family, phosphate regulon sensor histidine kinase PhoR